MPTKVIMPSLGESVVEGTITKWLKARGEKIEEFEPLLEINTDKVDTEVPSPASGALLDILIPEGSTVHAGDLLAWIGSASETPLEIESETRGQRREEPVQVTAIARTTETVGAPPGGVSTRPAAGRDSNLGFISPVVAKIASEEEVDLFQVEGTGQGGRITKRDILAYIERRNAAAPGPASTPAAPAKHETVLAVEPYAGPGEILPLTPVRRLIAEHMVNSKRTSPHVTTIMEVDLSRVAAHRQFNKDVFARDGVNLTYTAYFVAAVVAALKAFPIVNSSWSEQGILLHQQINIGIAASMGEAGLIVPVVKNADGLSLLGLSRAVNDLSNRARARQLKPDEVQGGTFTITNHGVSGSLFATPIINQPQCAILGVGAIQKRVVVMSDPVMGDMIAIRPMAYLTLTFDHRILDGTIADYFLAKVVETLKNWANS